MIGPVFNNPSSGHTRDIWQFRQFALRRGVQVDDVVSALNPTLPHAFRESTCFSCGFICHSTELTSCCLDFRLRSVGRLRNFGSSFVLAFFPLLGRFVRGATAHHRYDKHKTKRSGSASHSCGFHGVGARVTKTMSSLFHEKRLPQLSSRGALALLLRQHLAARGGSVSDRPRPPHPHRLSHSLEYVRVCRHPIEE